MVRKSIHSAGKLENRHQHHHKVTRVARVMTFSPAQHREMLLPHRHDATRQPLDSRLTKIFMPTSPVIRRRGAAAESHVLLLYPSKPKTLDARARLTTLSTMPVATHSRAQPAGMHGFRRLVSLQRFHNHDCVITALTRITILARRATIIKHV